MSSNFGINHLSLGVIASSTLAGDIITNPLNIQGLSNIGIQIIWPTAGIGTFTLEASNDNPNNITAGGVNDGSLGTWTTVTFTFTKQPNNAADTHLLDLNQLSWSWIRIRYTHTSGTFASFPLFWVSAKAI